MNRVGLLGASAFQAPLYETLIAEGFEVVVISPDGPYPLLKKGSAAYHIDVRDVDALRKLSRTVGIDFFVTDQTDLPVQAIYQLHRIMERKSPSAQEVARFTDKIAMRHHARNQGLKTPDWQEARTVQEADPQWLNHELIVVKPPDSQGSRGVSIGSPSKLASMITTALKFSLSGTAIIESFLSGEEFPLEGYIENGVYRTLAIGSRKDFSHAPGIPASAEYRAFDPLKKQDAEMHAAIKNYVESSGVINGVTHAEIMWTDDADPAIVEIALRGGASFISSHIVPEVSGFDMNRHIIASYSGTPLKQAEIQGSTASVGFHYFWSEHPLSETDRNQLIELPDLLTYHLPKQGESHYVGAPRIKPERLGPIVHRCTQRFETAFARLQAELPYLHFI